MDYRKTAEEIYEKVGRRENLVSAAHCATRLRLVLADDAKCDVKAVEEIDGVKVVDNDGSHAEVSATGRIALEKGLHPFRLLYFEDYEGQALSWGWMAPGETDFTDIPASVLFH